MIVRWIIALCITMAVLCSCNPRLPASDPQIEFTRVPPAHLGGGENLHPIEGRVRGAQPGQRVVLFAKGDVWWVQPFSAKPFTTINPDATWKNSTHSGTEYTALLVKPGYVPPLKTDALPSSGGSVVAVATVKGRGFQQETPQTIQFSGYDWEVRQIPSDRGGTTNDFDPANAWTDRRGRLHLQITRG